MFVLAKFCTCSTHQIQVRAWSFSKSFSERYKVSGAQILIRTSNASQLLYASSTTMATADTDTGTDTRTELDADAGARMHNSRQLWANYRSPHKSNVKQIKTNNKKTEQQSQQQLQRQLVRMKNGSPNKAQQQQL